MRKRFLLVAVPMAALLLSVALLLQPALAAPPAPPLTIVKTAEGDGTIAPGQTLHFTITVTNTGGITATNVTVRDDYDQVALPTIEVLPDLELETGSAQNDGDVITWQLGDLAPGKDWTANYEATAVAAFVAGITEVSNDASVYADGVKIDEDTVVLVVQAPQLTLTRQRERVDGEGEIVPGDTVRYTIRYGNDGTADATNVVIEETFEEAVVQQVDNITGEAQPDGATLRWSLGTVAAGASGEVSYEVTLKRALSLGTKDVENQATIRADDVEPVSASDSFVLRTPLLSIKREREDVNGGVIEPGDTLRFTIHFGNSGEVAASGVLIRDDFDETVVAEVSKISAGGREVEGAVEWELEEPLKPQAEKTVSYEVRLISDIAESTEAANIASICISGVILEGAKTTMTIESTAVRPTPPPEPTTPPAGAYFGTATTEVPRLVVMGLLVFVLQLGGLVVCAVVATRAEWDAKERSKVVRVVAVATVVTGAVLTLGLFAGIERGAAAGILGTVAGYLLRGIKDE